MDTLGGRSNGTEKEIGKLKWGVGKLIAHSPNRPTVIPLFFSGTETIIPTDPETGKTISYIPRLGHKVDLRVGQEISFDDLIAEHEKEYGPLWKYSANIDEDEQRGRKNMGSGDSVADEVKGAGTTEQLSKSGKKVRMSFHKYWDSKPSDLILYSKITARIESALSKLNEESNAEKALAA